MNETEFTVTVDDLSPDFKSGDVLHKSPCVFQVLLNDAENDLKRRREQVRNLRLQRTAWIIFTFAALGLGFLLGSIR